MKYKLLALDMDGTTLKNDGTLSKNTINSINKYIGMGGNVSIISGRNKEMLKKFVNEFNLNKFWHVGMNGIIVFNEDKIIPLSTMEQETYIKLLHLIRSRQDVSFLVFTHEKVYYEYAPKILEIGNVMGVDNLVEKCDLDSLTNVAKIVVYYNVAEDDVYWRNVCKEYNMEGVLCAENWFEIFSKGISKFTGIEKLEEILNIKNEETVAVGDQENDIEMVKNAGLGVAVENALDSVKDVSDLVLDKTNEEDAVSYLIENYLLK